MATSKIELFKTVITPQRNAQVDDLDTYLDTCVCTYQCDTYQYQKIELNTSFKINMPQDIYQPDFQGNYIRLEEIGKKYYYFVNSYEWKSVNAVQLNCTLDTVNTFKNDIEWSNKTNVIREHRDRLVGHTDKITTDIERRQFISVGPKSVEFTIQDERLKNTSVVSLTPFLSQGLGDCTLHVNSYDLDQNRGILEIYTIVSVNSVVNNKCTCSIYFIVDTVGSKRVIDKYPEQLNPVLYGKDLGTIEDTDTDNWYVIYITEKAEQSQNPTDPPKPRPIRTLLCKDRSFKTYLKPNEAAIGFTIKPEDIEYGKTYLINGGRDGTYPVSSDTFVHAYNTSGSQDIEKNKYEVEYIYPKGLKAGINKSVLFRKVADDKIEIAQVKAKATYLTQHYDAIFFSDNSNDYYNIYAVDKLVVESGYDQNLNINISDEAFPTTTGTAEEVRHYISDFQSTIYLPHSESSLTETEIAPISDIDRTNSNLVKIIKFPYCPIEYNILANGVYSFTQSCVSSSSLNIDMDNVLVWIPQDIKFRRRLKTNTLNILSKAHENIRFNTSPTGDEPRDDKYESKLYNSEFYQPKVVYDSFSKDFNLEHITDLNRYAANDLQVDFTPSKVYNSSFMLSFPDYITENYNTQDYNNIMIVNRNNEIPIYSDTYLNYVRTGYNYDVKNKNQRNVMNWVGTGLNAAGAVAGAVTGTSWLTAQGVTGTIGSIANNISSNIESERNIERKLAEMNAQSVSVSNCDDIDLLEAYSGNKAKLMVYKVSDKVKQDLADLFYYTGYTANDIKIPNLNTRYWFNFVQCEPVFENNLNVANNFVDDIKARFKDGVTIYHHHTANDKSWDWNQTNENWENYLVS